MFYNLRFLFYNTKKVILYMENLDLSQKMKLINCLNKFYKKLNYSTVLLLFEYHSTNQIPKIK